MRGFRPTRLRAGSGSIAKRCVSTRNATTANLRHRDGGPSPTNWIRISRICVEGLLFLQQYFLLENGHDVAHLHDFERGRINVPLIEIRTLAAVGAKSSETVAL